MTTGDEHLSPLIDEPKMSDGDRARQRAYFREFFPAIVLFVVAVFAATALVGDDPSVARRLLLLIPLIPALWCTRAIVRWVQRSDEYARAVQLEALAVGFGAAMFTAIAVGTVGAVSEPNRFNQFTPWLIYSVGMITWAITASIKSRQTA